MRRWSATRRSARSLLRLSGAAITALLLASDGAGQATVTITTPSAGTPTRRAVLDAIRRRLGIRVTFKVAHLAVAASPRSSVAFVRAGEIVRDGASWQETDLFVEALLERPANSRRWRVVAWWNLAESPDGDAHRSFLRQVHDTVRARGIPVALLPDDLRAVP